MLAGKGIRTLSCPPALPQTCSVCTVSILAVLMMLEQSANHSFIHGKGLSQRTPQLHPHRAVRSCDLRSVVHRCCNADDSSSGPAASSRSPLWQATRVLASVNALGFVISAVTGSHLHLDLLGTGAFVVAAATTSGSDLRSKLSAGAVGLWAARLSSFLFYRALQIKHDVRLDAILSTVSGAFGFWLISFVWGFVCILPHALGAWRDGSSPRCVRPRLGPLGAGGLALYAWGLTWEVLADWQKYWFLRGVGKSGRFCNVGLWSVSQHPNYFGNLCLWSGILVLNAAAVVARRPGENGSRRKVLQTCRLALGCMCPIFLALLFYGQASGRISPARSLMVEQFGHDPTFRSYIETVPLIVPRLRWQQ